MSVSMLTTWTLVLAAAIVLVLAVYLIGVAVQLYRASQHLAMLASGLIQVKKNAAPLEERLTTIAGALSALRSEFERVDGNLRGTTEGAEPLGE